MTTNHDNTFSDIIAVLHWTSATTGTVCGLLSDDEETYNSTGAPYTNIPGLYIYGNREVSK